MKELSIEQKAKRYDEALKAAKSNYETIVQMDNDCTFAKEGIVNTFHHMFPELKESEDERIRKEIINYFECQSRDEPTRKDIHNKWIAWLERQGEHTKFIDSIQVGDKVTRNQDGMLVNLSQLQRVAKPYEDIEIPLGAKDSELIEETIIIPEGCYAVIEGNNVIIRKG